MFLLEIFGLKLVISSDWIRGDVMSHDSQVFVFGTFGSSATAEY